MPLYYITGLSGAGKTAVRRELKARGYQAPGVDEEGYGEWIDRKTGQVVPFPHHDKQFDFHDWYEHHEWELSPTKVVHLKRRADKEKIPIFLCGSASGEDKVWHLFDQVIALIIDEETLKHRLATRTNNQYGKTPEELAIELSLYKTYKDTMKNRGALTIDATRPLAEVVGEILQRTAKSSNF
jgi:dephospho-CoA kinase